MPVDHRGFNRRTVVNQDLDHRFVHDLIFNFYHGPFGYSLRRYTPSLEFLAVIVGISHVFGYEFSPNLRMFLFIVLPMVRNKLHEQRQNRPYTLEVLLEGCWQTTRPNLVMFFVAFSPRVGNWFHGHIWSAWQGSPFAIQPLCALCVAIGIAICVERWAANSRFLKAGGGFKYSDDTLASTSDERHLKIRLLKVHRWVPWAGVRTTLFSVSIATVPVYEAISYTWGDPTKSHSMLVNGCLFKTTAATYNALYNSSQWWSSRVVWIDYVCIDQSNSKDKSKQVALMKEIYTNASKIIVSLTTSTKPKGFQRLVEFVFRHLRDEYIAANIVQEISELITHYRFPDHELAEFLEREGRSHRVFRLTALSDFLANPWFARVWIVQEVAVAKKIFFLYGNQDIEWNTVWNTMSSFQEPEMAAVLAANGNRVDLMNTRHFHTLSRIRTDTITLQKHERRFRCLDEDRPSIVDPATLLPITLLLAKCADFQATDARDKVYAMLGLSSDDSRQSIRPDYERKTTRDVYVELATYVSGTRDPLALLPYAGTSDRSPASVANLPSWVPDWSSPPAASALDQPLHNHYDKTRYYASLYSYPKISLNTSTNILTIGGAILDQIATVAPVCYFPPSEHTGPVETYGAPFNPLQIAEHIEWHDTSFDIALGATRLRSSVEEAFWRTLIGDMAPSIRPAPARLGGDYRRWIDSLRLVYLYQQHKGKSVTLPAGLAPVSPEFAIWGTAMGLCAVKRRICVTSGGYLGMVPLGSRAGDLVAVFLGAKTPYVLRRTRAGMKEAFELIGECYIDGMMDGEMMGMLPRTEQLVIV